MPQLQTQAELFEAALALPSEQRQWLAEQLWLSLNGDTKGGEPPLSPAWAAELDRRLADFKAGRAKTVSAEHVFRNLRQTLAK